MLKLIVTLMLFAVFSTVEAADNSGYEYVSPTYNYSIVCSKQPNVIPIRVLFEDDNRDGEILVFENDGYYIKSGLVITFNAFDPTLIPNFNKDSKKLIEQYIEAKKNDGYERLELIEIAKGNKGVMGITAKEIGVDEDGDGTVDGVAIADRQEAVVFFRSTLGRCIAIEMMGDEINEATLNELRSMLSTFKEVNPNDKKDKKDKKAKQG